MKSIAILVIGLVLGALGMFLCMSGTPPVAADCTDNPCANPACCNGDVNASGTIDIADPIYLLTYLFKHGPEPAPTGCCLPCKPWDLSATGQTKCYDTTGNEIDCTSTDWPGQDGFYQKGCPTVGRFVDNGDGTVTDDCTGLMWQKNTVDINGDGAIVWEQDAPIWQQALQYCENLEFAGHSDWRLPNVRELQSIADYGRVNPSIDPVFGAESGLYWSSSNHFVPGLAWIVYFYDGLVGYGDGKAEHGYVRAVRG